MDYKRKVLTDYGADEWARLEGWLRPRANFQTDTDNSSEDSLEDCTSDKLEKEIVKTKAEIISSVRSIHESILQKALDSLPEQRKQVVMALSDKLKENIERKVQEMERDISRKLEEKLQAMKERINAAEEKLVNGKSNVSISGVHDKEEPSASCDNTENHMFPGIMITIRDMHDRLDVLEAAVQNLVA